MHELEFHGSFSRNDIPGPVVKLNVIPDPSNPVRLDVDYDSDVIFTAGDTFPGVCLFVCRGGWVGGQKILWCFFRCL